MAGAPRAGFSSGSEVTVPMRKDAQSFEDRQRTIWEEMHEQMERRRTEWEEEVAHLKKDFFRLKPDSGLAGGGGLAGGQMNRLMSGVGDNSLEKMDLSSMFYDKAGSQAGEKVFRVCFDVAQFNPDEISVRSMDGCLVVHARHVETNDGKTTSREFSRKVDIPQGIDPMSLRSTLSQDGILQVEADVPAPSYNLICDERGSMGPSRLCAVAHSPQAFVGYMQGAGGAAGGAGQLQQLQQQQAVSAYLQPDGAKVFRVSVDIGAEFRPEELQVKTVDRKLIVHARHEERTLGRTSTKEFNREFDLPDAIDPNRISANMTGDGRLVLEAPFETRQ